MPFELEPSELKDNLDWLYTQDYAQGENHVTEALFKWFFFSNPKIQKRFLSKICGVPGRRASWKRLNLQRRGKRGTPDAVLTLANGSELLFEVKVKQQAVSRKQAIRHLKDAGIGTRRRARGHSPKLLVITPDFREPEKLARLPDPYRQAVVWVPWIEVIHFLKKLRSPKSSDRLLRDGLLLFLIGQRLSPV